MMTESYNSAILAVTETHLDSDIKDAEINMDGFQLFRADRVGRKHGGVAIYVREDLAVNSVKLSGGSNGVVEHLMLHIKQYNVVVLVIYRPPDCQNCEFVPIIDDLKRKCLALGDPTPSLIVCGDFNIPDVNWESVAVGTTTNRTQLSPFECMKKMRDELFLHQIVEAPTRGNNLLDLCFVNNADLLWNAETKEIESLSDHKLVVIDTAIGVKQPRGEKEETHRGFHNLNFFSERTKWEDMAKELGETNWHSMMHQLDVEAMYQTFHRKLLDVCEKYTPVRRPKAKRRGVPRDRKRLYKKKAKAEVKLNTGRGNAQYHREQIKELDRQIEASHRAEALENEKRAVNVIKENPKYFYNYAKSKAKTRVGIGPLRTDENSQDLKSDSKNMANLLSQQFASSFSTPRVPEHHMGTDVPVEQHFSALQITKDDIETSIKELRSNASAGPDGIPVILLKKVGDKISMPLCLLWNKSLREGYIPLQMKKGKVTPIFKGGDRSLPRNYRPVTLTSHIIKLFEKILVQKLDEHMNMWGLHDTNQHGFRRNRSCLSQLLDHHQEIVEMMSKGEDVDVIYLDFAKAFDKVDHNVLMNKLSSIGISGEVYNWIRCFLTGRTQTACVEGTESEEFEVRSGVPQGSVLGPLLFVIHISDIGDKLVHSSAGCFADDTRLLKSVCSTVDCVDLQRDLRRVFTWADKKNMTFNSSKFKTMRYTASSTAQPVEYVYKTRTDDVDRSESVTDLGVIMNESATFKKQIEKCASKAKGQIGWILRVFATREKLHMITLYKSLVLPFLEYCCPLWSPTDRNIALVRQLESAQRSFTRRIAGMSDLDYWTRLKRLNMFSLERRRERYCIIYVWKILNFRAPNFGGNIIREYFDNRRGRLCSTPPLISGSSDGMKSIRDDTLAVRGPKLFNAMPIEIRSLTGTLEQFKAHLDKFILTVPDEPQLPGYQRTGSNSLVEQVSRMRRGAAARD